MARRRPSTKRRSTSGRTKGKGSGTRSDGVSKSKGQADLASNEDGSIKENCDPLDPPSSGKPQGKGNTASPLHRPNLLNNLINGTSGRDSACSTPSCETPLGSYDSSRTGTPSMQTPSIRTPSMRTPSLFSQSFDNSSFDASSLEYESNYDSSTCGTPVTPGSRPLLLDVSSSLEETSRAKKKTEKRKRYRRNRRLRMLAALHMEELEREKALAKINPDAEKKDMDGVQSTKDVVIEDMDVQVPKKPEEVNGIVAHGLTMGSDDEASETGMSKPGVMMTVKERENVDEIVDEGFSEHFDKAQRKDIEEAIVITNECAADAVKELNNKDTSVNVIRIELEGEAASSMNGETERSIMTKCADGFFETPKDEMDKITSEVLENRILNEKNGEENEGVKVSVSGVLSPAQCQTEDEDGGDGKGQGTDNPPKGAEGQDSSPPESNSPSEESTEEESVGSPSKGDPISSSSQSSGHLIPDETDDDSKDGPLKRTGEKKKEEQHPPSSSSSSEEEIETVKCTKAMADEVSSAIINDNLQLINPTDKVELVEVVKTEGYPENLVVMEMKSENGVSSQKENEEKVEEEKKEWDELSIPKLTFTEVNIDDEGNEQVVEIPMSVESGYEDIFPKEHVEVVDVMKGEGEDGDILIFEVKDPDEEATEEAVENGIEGTEHEEEKGSEEEKEIVVARGESNEVKESKAKEESEPLKKDVDAKDETTSRDAPGTVDRDATKKPAGKVDAALAELDSIPDGVCESGEVEEEEEDEEEWSYYRMEPQTQPQGEDVLVGGVTPAAVAPPPSEDIEILSEPSDMVHDQDIVPVPQDNAKDTTQDQVPEHFDEQPEDFLGNLSESQPKYELLENLEEKQDTFPSMDADEAPFVARKTPDILETSMDMIPSLDDHPERLINFSGPGIDKTENLMETSMHEPSSPHDSGSPRIPGSPRSVEGFITSVELNTPDESFATNFAVNQAQDAFAAVVDQTSGPFSVYVSSSPEPASLDPPMQSNVDLLNLAGGMTNGQADEEHASMNQTSEPHEEVSPVEIVHAQSTVEVVAPPSPVDVSGPETQFIIPEHQAPESPTSDKMLPTDISFVPQPIIEPSAEVPVPVYVDDTPVSEPDFIGDVNQSVSMPPAVDMVNMSQTADDFMSETKMQMDVLESASSEVLSKVESFVETSQTEIAETVSHVESKSETLSHIAAETFSQVQSATEAYSEMESEFETKNELSQISSPVPALSQVETTPVSPAEMSPLPADFETVPPLSETAVSDVASPPVDEVSEVTPQPVDTEVVSAPVIDIPEVASKLVKSPDLVEAKTPSKTAKTPAKSDKATPAKAGTGKATPSRATPGKATPGRATPTTTRTPATRTPSTRTPTTKTPVTKSTEKKTPTPKPATPGSASRTTAAKPSTTRPATTKPAPAKPAAAKPASTRPAAKPAPTRTPATRSPMTASKPAEKPKPTGPSAPRAGTTARPTRPTPAARTTTTTTRKTPDTTKPADKTDGTKLVNGTTSRPSSRPGTARSTTTTTARKPLSSSTTRGAPKPAAEKETKNTTNQILSTRPSKPASATTKAAATRTSTAHSTSRTATRTTESASAAKSRMTSTTKSTTASRTTGAATKKTLVSKTKTSQAGAKETSVKTKTEAAVIDKTELLVNGENKIADEETSVEVIEKCAVEDIMQASNEKLITETMTSSEQVVVTTETTEVLVNGDH